jgi:formate dehydrogenase major subunit
MKTPDDIEGQQKFGSHRLDAQPFSPNSIAKHSRLRNASVSHSICPYCAVGCSQLVYTKAGQIIDIEGDPASPINEGTLCPKGSNTFQIISNPHRETKVKYRAPYSDHWEEKPLDWAMERIAQLVKKTRDEDLMEAWALFRSKTRRGYDTALRCPVWAPHSAAEQQLVSNAI